MSSIFSHVKLATKNKIYKNVNKIIISPTHICEISNMCYPKVRSSTIFYICHFLKRIKLKNIQTDKLENDTLTREKIS